jgi:hypothetical protein
MTAPYSKSSFRVYAVLASLAALVLLAGCWLDKPIYATEYAYAEVSFQATVKNNTSAAVSVSFLPALGSRKSSGYQWAIGREEIERIPDSFPTETVVLAANSEQVVRTYFGQEAYEGFQVGDKILSFLAQIDRAEYAGWDAQYGTGGRTLVGQGYGYDVLAESIVPKWHSSLPPGNEYTNLSGWPWVTVRYTITIADGSVDFALDEVAYCVREYPTDFQDDADPDGG